MKFGWIPDKPDARDRRFYSVAPSYALPDLVDLSGNVVDILDQGNTSSCVAHAWAQALRMMDRINYVAKPALPSREFLYFNARAYDGGPILDQGTQLRSCAQGITKFGRPPESSWPFDESKVNERPSWESYREAYDFKGPAGYLRVVGNDEIKAALAARKPVVGGVQVSASIQSYTGGIYDPSPDEEIIGGHALCIVGYDPSSFHIVNSWGAGYGEKGFIRVSPAFMSRFTDLWSLHL